MKFFKDSLNSKKFEKQLAAMSQKAEQKDANTLKQSLTALLESAITMKSGF